MVLTIKKALFVVVLLAAVALARPTAPANAQNGACPQGTVLKIPPLAGWYPAGLAVCEVPNSTTSVSDSRYPCGQFLTVIESIGTEIPLGFNRSVYMIPPVGQNYGRYAKLSFMIMLAGDQSIVNAPPPASRDYVIEYYNSDGQRVRLIQGDIQDSTVITGWWGEFPRFFYNVYLVEEIVDTSALDVVYGQAGYFRFKFNDYADHPEPNRPFEGVTYSMASIHVSAQSDYVPHCPIPNAALPLPTATVGVGTPTPVPPTATPTAIFSTQTPAATIPVTPTPTPFAFATFPPQATPTPIIVAAIPTLYFPAITWPTVPPPPAYTATPSSTTAATAVPPPPAQSTIMADIEAVATLWAGPLLGAQYTLSDSNLISNTNALISETVPYVALPFQLVRGVETFMPNTWPFVLIIFALVFVRLGVPIVLFVINLVAQFIEIVRKLWEALPLN